MISNCERAGCAGLVRFYESEELQFNSPIPPIFWWSCRNCSYLAPQNSIDFPVVQSQIGQQALLLFGAILTMPNLTIVFPEVNVTVNSDINYYQYVGGTYGIFYQVWMGLWSLFNTICAAVFIYAQLKKRRAEFPLLAVVALSLECFANAMRFTICVVDPLVVWGVYWPISVLQIWSSFFFSWSLIATFLIAFFWFKLSFHFGRKLDTRSPAVIIPVIFVSILILAVEYIPLCILIFSPIYVGNTLLGRVIAQSLCYWIISAFFIVSGIRVLILMRRGTRLHGKDRRQKSMASFIIADACLLTAFGCFIYAFTDPTAQRTNMWYGLATVQSAFLLTISTIQIWVFATSPSGRVGHVSTTADSQAGGASTTMDRDSDGYIKADAGCCGIRLGRRRKSSTGNTSANDTLASNAVTGKSLDVSMPEEDVVTGVVEL
jgi:hypothetical protein